MYRYCYKDDGAYGMIVSTWCFGEDVRSHAGSTRHNNRPEHRPMERRCVPHEAERQPFIDEGKVCCASSHRYCRPLFKPYIEVA